MAESNTPSPKKDVSERDTLIAPDDNLRLRQAAFVAAILAQQTDVDTEIFTMSKSEAQQMLKVLLENKWNENETNK